MKFEDAKRLIEEHERPKPKGYRVHFERIEGRMLTSDYFPDHSEYLIETERLAWEYCARFAAATKGRNVNLYVCDEQFRPVIGYAERKIENR